MVDRSSMIRYKSNGSLILKGKLMTDLSPPVRDFTDQDRTISVLIDDSPVHEVLSALFVAAHRPTEYEIGSDIIERFDRYASDQLRIDIETTGPCGEAWLWLIGVAHSLPEPRTVGDLTAYLETMDPISMRRELMGTACLIESKGFDASALEGAAAGEPEAVAGLVEQLDEESGLRSILQLSPSDTRNKLVRILQQFTDEVFPKLEIDQSIRERDARDKRAMARIMSANQLVETATNGVTFTPQPEVGRVLMIPSIAARPWVLISDYQAMRIFVYPVADEHLTADPDAPPGHLITFFKALGDEKRLRILRMLHDGSMSLAEMTERLDLAKSTAHHHLRVLRVAGLVRVSIDENKAYSLRADATSEVGHMLEQYLTGQRTQDNQKHE
jgi:DNA-binding transcriptional ArsR family regulator